MRLRFLKWNISIERTFYMEMNLTKVLIKNHRSKLEERFIFFIQFIWIFHHLFIWIFHHLFTFGESNFFNIFFPFFFSKKIQNFTKTLLNDFCASSKFFKCEWPFFKFKLIKFSCNFETINILDEFYGSYDETIMRFKS